MQSLIKVIFSVAFVANLGYSAFGCGHDTRLGEFFSLSDVKINALREFMPQMKKFKDATYTVNMTDLYETSIAFYKVLNGDRFIHQIKKLKTGKFEDESTKTKFVELLQNFVSTSGQFGTTLKTFNKANYENFNFVTHIQYIDDMLKRSDFAKKENQALNKKRSDLLALAVARRDYLEYVTKLYIQGVNDFRTYAQDFWDILEGRGKCRTVCEVKGKKKAKTCRDAEINRMYEEGTNTFSSTKVQDLLNAFVKLDKRLEEMYTGLGEWKAMLRDIRAKHGLKTEDIPSTSNSN